MRALLHMAVALTLAWGAPAAAVIIASGDGRGNTTAPADDPGFAHVGITNGLSGVYIGDGWILTARHVCRETKPDPCDIAIEGVIYREVSGSRSPLLTDGVDPSDLILYRIASDPGLPFLPIAANPPAGEVVMIGRGKNRGDPVYDWDFSPDLDGWYWGGGATVRWGTNQVKSVSLESSLGGRTVVFTTDFTGSGGTTHECQVATGDSGGAVFSKVGGWWELTGIHHARGTFSGQDTWELENGIAALFGNESWSAQLSDYRDQILDIIALAGSACSNGVDDDGDGFVDHPDDPGCLDAYDAFERSIDLPCDDGLDNDDDGRVDFSWWTNAYPGDETTPPLGEGDPGCRGPAWSTESPECQDGIDNDGDGMMDYDAGLFANGSADPAGPDPQCVGTPWRDLEREATYPRRSYPCGLGAELALILPALLWMRRRRG